MNQEGKRKEKQDRLLDAMGQIDDSFVEAAQKAGRRKTARPGVLSFGAARVLAACAALAVCVVLYRFAAIKPAAPVQEQEAPAQEQEEPVREQEAPVREAVPEGRSARSVGQEAAAEPAPASLEENAAEDIDGQAAALTQEKAEGVLGVVLEADGGRVTFRIVNGTDQEISYGKRYALERMEENGWQTVEPSGEVAWEDVLFLLQAGESAEDTIELSQGYDRLEDGQYRLVKWYFLSGEEIPLYLEFIVDSRE